MKMVVLCKNVEGAPEFHSCDVDVTAEQAEEGAHYALAIDNATAHGYEGPFEAFDETDPAAKQLFDLGQWMSRNCTDEYLQALAAVIDMARSHVDDIGTGIEEGIYDVTDNQDLEAKRRAVETMESIYRLLPAGMESHWLVVVEGDVEPFVTGPFASVNAVLAEAQSQRANDPEMENGLFWLDIRGGVPAIGAYNGGLLDR